MNIRSDITIDNNLIFSLLWKSANIVSIAVCLIFIGMSFNYIPQDKMILVAGCIIYVVFKSLVYNYATPSWYKEQNTNNIKFIIRSQIIIGPIYLFVLFLAYATLITFNLFGWEIFILTIFAMSIISNSYTSEHKNKK